MSTKEKEKSTIREIAQIDLTKDDLDIALLNYSKILYEQYKNVKLDIKMSTVKIDIYSDSEDCVYAAKVEFPIILKE